MRNFAITLDFTGSDVTYAELRRFVEATAHYKDSEEVFDERDANGEFIGLKAWT